MRPISKISLCLLLFAAIAAVYIGLFQSGFYRATKQSKQPSVYNAYMLDSTITNYNQAGRVNFTLTAKTVQHYKNRKMTYFSAPVAVLDSQRQPPWNIHANHASRNDSNTHIRFWGHVLITQHHQNPQYVTTITTSRLTYFPKQHLAHTNTEVTLKRNHSTIEGKGATLYLKTNVVKIQSQTQANFAPTAPSK